MKRPSPQLSIEELRMRHAERSAEIRDRLAEFRRIPASDYFYELVYCLLTPQSSAAHAGAVVAELRRLDFLNAQLDPEPILRRKECYVRFHRTKARHLLAAKERRLEVLPHLSNGSTSEALREWLVANVKGLGWKEASHFLRNVGRRELAILDRHILKNLVRVRVLRRLPSSLTPKRYRAIERKFRKFALDIGIPMDELDLLFWSMETGEILK